MSKIRLVSISKTTLIALAIGLLLVTGFAALVKWAPFSKHELPVPISPEEVHASSLEYVSKGDASGGLEYYDEQIDNAQNSGEKRQLLIYKADFAQRVNRPDDAIAAVRQADDISSGSDTVQALAMAYEASGNKEQAIIYYRKIIDMSPDDDMEASYISLWEKKIEELQQ